MITMSYFRNNGIVVRITLELAHELHDDDPIGRSEFDLTTTRDVIQHCDYLLLYQTFTALVTRLRMT